MKVLGWMMAASVAALSGCTTGINDAPVDGGNDAPAVTNSSSSTTSSSSSTAVGSHDGAAPEAGVAAKDATPDVAVVGTVDAGNPSEDASGPAPGQDAGGSDAAGLVINEVCGKGVNYVELFNAGTTPIDLSGWGVTEAKDNDAGVPGNPKSPALFPAGTTLAAGDYALATSAPSDGGTTLMGCPASVCVVATWGISNSSGATVYLVDPAGTTVAQVAFPRETTGSGQSWGRLPNGTGAFALTTQTPGVVNKGP